MSDHEHADTFVHALVAVIRKNLGDGSVQESDIQRLTEAFRLSLGRGHK